MQSIETDDILFEILNASAELKAALSGGIFVQGERPDNSGKEDVVINYICIYQINDNKPIKTSKQTA